MSNKDVRTPPNELHEKPHVVANAGAAIILRTVLLLLEQGIALVRPFVSDLQGAHGEVSATTALLQIMVASHKQLLQYLDATGLREMVTMEDAEAPLHKGPGAEE